MKIPIPFDRGNATPEERIALWEGLCVVLASMREAGMLNDAVRLTDAPPTPFGRGASGPFVVAWQSIVGAKPDGDFGPKTEAATKAWSRLAGFGERARVEPAMWALAFGVTLLLADGEVVQPDGTRIGLAAAASHVKEVFGPP